MSDTLFDLGNDPKPPAPPKRIAVWHHSLSAPRPCSGPTCRDKIIWAELVDGGRKMCFTFPALPRRTENVAGRLIAYFDYHDNHWRTCPDRDRFRRKK